MSDPIRCREFARQCRDLARTASETTANMLCELASSYEELADTMERGEHRPANGPPIA